MVFCVYKKTGESDKKVVWGTNHFNNGRPTGDNRRVTEDSQRYIAFVEALSGAAVSELSDIIANPSATERFQAIKTAILTRFQESADTQLRKLFGQLQLADSKPSQLLRQMKSLAAGKVTEEILKIRWLDLLPPQVNGMLRIMKKASLVELSSMADELTDSLPHVNAVTAQATLVPPTPPAASTAPVNPAESSLAQEVADMRRMLNQLFAADNHKPGLVLVPRVRSSCRKLPSLLHLLLYEAGKPVGPPPLQVSEAGNQGPSENRFYIYDRESRIHFLFDSGSVVSLLPKGLIKNCKLQPQPLTLTAASASPIATYGTHILTIELGLRRAATWSSIVTDTHVAIIGANFLAHFGYFVDVKGKRLIDPMTSLSTPGSLARTTIHSVSVITSPARTPSGDLGQRYADVFVEYADLCFPEATTAALPDLPVHHTIHTTGPPVFERPQRLLRPRLQAAKEEIGRLLDQGIVRPSSSQWASPLNLVEKSSEGWRVTRDYRCLNACITPDHYPLPIIDDLLQEAARKVFSVADLRKAFYQIPITENDIPKTVVTTPFGLYEFTRSSMGQHNAAQSLQRTMDHVLRELPFARCYLDDIFVAFVDHEQHLKHLCQVEYLGYTVSDDGVCPPARKVQAIQDFPKLENSTELRRFLGMLNFDRRCMPGAAKVMAPLNDLLRDLPPRKKKAPLTWTPEADVAVQQCKDALAKAATMTFLRSNSSIALRTDASDTAIGAVLEQEHPRGTWKPLSFFSRKLSETERRCSAHDRELLAIFAAIKTFERVQEGRPFTVYTDHKPLTFAVTLSHVKGEENVVADALSRINAVAMPSIFDPEVISNAQAVDDELEHLLDDPHLSLQPMTIDGHIIRCDISTGTVRPYLPESLRKIAFEVLHNLVHPSIRATVRLVTEKFM
ncbi:uncharacterized protein LOC106642446 [Copidosoma floridanum]|uniref:uncharacterized protein LOC106642446 n=1 Tax=Copidosoma floridanum TaxID=29053 RepID=UPI0006C9D0EC|nr:uncharacterized protein LOC106642446 [Copidosoma floridanum]